MVTENKEVILSSIPVSSLIEMIDNAVEKSLSKKLVAKERVDESQLLSPNETCKLFEPAISRATLWRWDKAGILKSQKIGGRVFYVKTDVEEVAKNYTKYHTDYRTGKLR